MEQVGRQLEEQTRAQVVAVVVPDMGGEPIEEYATEMFRSWGLGNKKENNGVLLLIAMKERQSRIEVGYGLEGALSDHLAGRIQDRYLIPDFQRQEYSKGIRNTYGAIVSAAAREYKAALKNPDQAKTAAAHSENAELPWWAQLLLIVGAAIFLLIDWTLFGGMMTITLLQIVLRRGGRGGGRYGGRYGGGSSGGGGAGRNW